MSAPITDIDPLYGDVVWVNALHEMAREWMAFGMSYAYTREESRQRKEWRIAARELAAKIGREL